MRRRVLTVFAAVALALVLSPVSTYAQVEVRTATVHVAFPFVAEGKTMPPGQYDLRISTNQETATLIPASGSGGVILPVVTRLDASSSPAHETRVVFDKVGTKRFLSEAWLPGEDGYLFYAAKEKHTHEIVKGQMKGK